MLDADIHQYIRLGASPRASESLLALAKAFAFSQHRDFVNFDDVATCAGMCSGIAYCSTAPRCHSRSAQICSSRKFLKLLSRIECHAMKSEKSLLSKKELLEIFINHRVHSPFPGDWESIFKGLGYEFWALRELEPTDSFKNIDWKAKAKTGKYFVREFLAESYFNVMLLYDISRSVILAARSCSRRTSPCRWHTAPS